MYLAGNKNPSSQALCHVNTKNKYWRNSPANRYRLKETKEKTVKGAKLWEVTQCIIVWSNRKEAAPYWSFREEPSAINVAVFKGKRLVITEMIMKKVEDE